MTTSGTDLLRLDLVSAARAVASGEVDAVALTTAYLDRAIGNFMTNSVTGMEQIREAIETGDAAALRQHSHRLAGGALNLGVTYAGEAVRLVEAISDEGTVEGAAELLPQVEEALERGRRALAAYQEDYRSR